jgi:1-acyl-sn-glycerol-3-phosphate acyltransferase
VNGVRQGSVVAFGVTDTHRGTEQLIVVAETKEKSHDARKIIATNIKEALSTALYIAPDQVVMVDPRTVPKTSSGKLQRAACKQMYLDGKLHQFHVPEWLQIVKLGAEWLFQKTKTGITAISKLIYTLYVATLVLISFFPLYLIVCFASPSFAAKTCRVWARWILRFALCPVEIVGAENLTKRSPVIFVANHSSYLDSIVTLAIAPAGTRFVGKKELFTAPILRTFMRNLNYLSVDRQDLPKGIEDTQHIQEALKSGASVFIFPEGTFGYASGLRPFKLGAFKIAAEANVAICPVALRGVRRILRGEEKTMRPGMITVTVCEPIMAAGAEWQDITKMRDAVRTEIAKYCGESSLDMISPQTIAPPRSSERV